MKRYLPLLVPLSIFFVASCKPKSTTKSTEETSIKDPVEKAVVNKDSLLRATGKSVLASLRSKDFSAFSGYFTSNAPVRFSPYGYIDTASHRSLTKAAFDSLLANNQVVNWGSYDGSGDPIDLTLNQYLDKFVYNKDFFEAEKIAVDSIIGKGNSLVNIDKIYPGARFIEYHFSGFDKKYAGMDWTSLRLVFKEEGEKFKLIAVVHDQWTI